MAEIENSNESVDNKSLINYINDSFSKNLRQYTMLIALLGIMLIFTILTNGTFMTSRNLSNLLLQTVHIAILSVGMVYVIVAGHIDLSAGFAMGFCGAVAAIFQVKLGLPTPIALLLTMGVGVLIGMWQGYWVAYQNVPAFIVTLAGMQLFKGALVGITGGATVAPLSNSFKAIGQDYLPRIIPDLVIHDTTFLLGLAFVAGYIWYEMKTRKGRMKYDFAVLPWSLQLLKMIGVSLLITSFFMIMVLYMGMPYSVLIVIALAILFTYIAKKTPYGRHVYAIGGNKEAARLSGINIKQRTMLIFVIMGALYALSGIVFTARLNSASTSAGVLVELEVIAACIIGGTSTLGGAGTVMGALIGALVMSTLNNGMSLMNVSSTYQLIIKGLVLLIAVWIDISSRQKGK